MVGARAEPVVVQVAEGLIQRRHSLNVEQVPRKLPALQQDESFSPSSVSIAPLQAR